MTNTFHGCINYPEYGGHDFYRLRSGPFEGPAIVIPPALPEDTYYFFLEFTIGGDAALEIGAGLDPLRCYHDRNHKNALLT